ncbi:hypothetical protein JW921_04120 [Candidatus Fermentibacterales bacterium]|nr:hypothetical protein [Candidatus Fermentibacterales bacterium]
MPRSSPLPLALILLVAGAAPGSFDGPVPGFAPASDGRTADPEASSERCAALPGRTLYSYPVPELVAVGGLPTGLVGFTAPGCGLASAGGDGSSSEHVLLPSRLAFFSVPFGVRAGLSVTANGVQRLTAEGAVALVTPTPSGDRFTAAADGNLPSSWAELVSVSDYRGIRLAAVRINPVILSADWGGLCTARGLRISLDYGAAAGSPVRAPGEEARFYDLLLEGGSMVWRSTSAREQADSPFWGRPWARIQVDTTGIYRLRGHDVPWAVGQSASGLALYCGRGREMDESRPWSDAYSPVPVSIAVDDGGDGILDEEDTILFHGRGLSWWEASADSMPEHYTHRYDEENCYWLTWGGEGGSFMDTLSGAITGEPALPAEHLGMSHFEVEAVWMLNFVDSDWVWDRNSGSGTQWLYHLFELPECSGEGYVRLLLRSEDGGRHAIRVYLDQEMIGEASWIGTSPFVPVFPCSTLEQGSARLGVEIIRESSSETIVLDWFDVFYRRPNNAVPGLPIPLDSWNLTGRRRLDWGAPLDDMLVVVTRGDSSASLVSTGQGATSFELDLPEPGGRLLYVISEDDLLSPLSIEEAAPGRIMGTLSGARALYVAADHLASDVRPLADRDGWGEVVTTTEVYDELNGGVRDPHAIRALADQAVSSWDPAPTDVILVGSGHYDPRGHQTTRISYIEPLFTSGGYVMDDLFGTISGDSVLPQVAISRMSISSRSELQLLVGLSLSYWAGEASGDWQARVIGAADDERSGSYSQDEVVHTQDMEETLEGYLPSRFESMKHYLIFYDWDELWNKPEARQDLRELWSEGALLFLYLGHGGFDQVADEGLMYLEDADLLSCGSRLPIAFFGSCSVGEFHSPLHSCLAQEVTTCPGGGAIAGIGATGPTGASSNASLIRTWLDLILPSSAPDVSMGQALLVAKLLNGYTVNDAQYVLFGDGSIQPAVPSESGFHLDCSGFHTGEPAVISGICPATGVATVQAFESCRPDTYYTFRQSYVIAYLSKGAAFFDGSVTADPAFETGVFVPVDADTGAMARLQSFFFGSGMVRAAAAYPLLLDYGYPSGSDSAGPEIELWLDGFRHVENPVVSGEVSVRAELSDSSGIDLLGNTGRQLALYVDGEPSDVSSFFSYYPGSWTTGSLEVSLGTPAEGDHQIELRASDGVLNRSSQSMGFSVLEGSGLELDCVFVYPCPCSDTACFSWFLGQDALVSIDIYTVTGRRVFSAGNIAAGTGYNQYKWDGRDSDGDRLASGTYVYVLSAEAVSVGGSGGSASETGVLAVIR